MTPTNPTSWRARFDQIGFGNQAIIVGAKRKELKDFISQELKSLLTEVIEQVAKEVLGEDDLSPRDTAIVPPGREVHKYAFFRNDLRAEQLKKLLTLLKQKQEEV